MGLPARANADCAAKIVSRARGIWSYRRGRPDPGNRPGPRPSRANGGAYGDNRRAIVCVSTLVLRRHYARYFEAQEEHGVRSVESRKASNPVAFGIIGLVAVFAAIFLVVFKGVTL